MSSLLRPDSTYMLLACLHHNCTNEILLNTMAGRCWTFVNERFAVARSQFHLFGNCCCCLCVFFVVVIIINIIIMMIIIIIAFSFAPSTNRTSQRVFEMFVWHGCASHLDRASTNWHHMVRYGSCIPQIDRKGFRSPFLVGIYFICLSHCWSVNISLRVNIAPGYRKWGTFGQATWLAPRQYNIYIYNI